MTDPITISVIVPTKNAAATLDACLASIRSQTCAADVELVVVDNHSTDGTLEIAQRWADIAVTAGPERCAQRNLGARLARGAVLVFIDADMVLEEDILEEASVEIARGCDQVVLSELASAEGFIGRGRQLEKELYLGDPSVEAARAFRRDVFEIVGGYDEARNSFEDWDLADRVAATGAVTGRTTSVIWHQEGVVSLRTQFRKKRYYGRQSGGYLLAEGVADHRTPLARTSLLRRPGMLLRSPLRTTALVLLKSTELAGMAVGAFESSRSSAGGAQVEPAGTAAIEDAASVVHVISEFSPHEAMGRAIVELASHTTGTHHLVCAKVKHLAEAEGHFASVTEVGGQLTTFLLTRGRRVRRAVQAAAPDVVHVHGGPFVPVLAAARALRGYPKLLSIYAWPTLPRLSRIRTIGLRSVVRSQVLPLRVVVGALVPPTLLSRWARRTDVAGVLTQDATISARLGTTVDVETVPCGAAPGEAVATWSGDAPTVVFAGRAELVRGLDALVDAMRLVRQDVPGVRLRLLLLERPDLAEVTAAAVAALGDAVEIVVGPHTDLRTAFVECAVAVFPFRFDHVTLSPTLTAAEALACGLPVVATDVSCLTAIVEDGVNGAVVPVDDVPAIAGAITSLLVDRSAWERAATGALATAARTTGWQSLVAAADRKYSATRQLLEV